MSVENDMSDYFTSKEYLEFEADAKIQVSELDSWFEAHPLCESHG